MSLFVGKFVSDRVTAFTKQVDEMTKEVAALRLEAQKQESEISTMRQLFDKRLREAEGRMAQNTATLAAAETALKFLLGHHPDDISDKWQRIQNHLSRCVTEFVVKNDAGDDPEFKEAIQDRVARKNVSDAVSAFGQVFDINPGRKPLRQITERGFTR